VSNYRVYLRYVYEGDGRTVCAQTVSNLIVNML